MNFGFLTQPELVRLSLLVDEQRDHRHDAPARRRTIAPAVTASGAGQPTADGPAPRVVPGTGGRRFV